LDVQETDKVALCLPMELGANFTVPALLCPGDKVSGRVQPWAENAPPVTLNFVMVRLDFP
jgi:hypothetical protein